MSINACIDGWNLALPNGSGIATYGHTLLNGLADAGISGQVLYAPSTSRQPSAIMDETALIAHSNSARRGGKLRALSTLTARFGRAAYPVHFSKEVIWPSQGMAHPNATHLWASREIYPLAIRAFQNYGHFTPISFRPENGEKIPDVMHLTCPIPLHAPQCANILTIHDTIPLKLPASTRDNKEKYFSLLKQSCDKSDHILCITESTKNDLLKYVDIKEEKITVTYQPSIITDAKDDNRDDLCSDFGILPKEYFLFYGAIEPKKNLGRIVEAYLMSATKSPLVVVGGRSWLSEHETGLLNSVVTYGNRPIIQLDYLPRSALSRLIKNARAVLFPSLHEGFGLPVLEAMNMGTPVLTSRGGALEEVAGDAAELVSPWDVSDICRGLRALDSDESYRNELSIKGIERAKMFSAERYAKTIRQVYDKIGI